jgi:VWFA-related protein
LFRSQIFRSAILFCGSVVFVSGHTVSVTVLVRAEGQRALSSLTAKNFRILDAGVAREVISFSNLRPSQELQTRRPPRGYFISNRPLAAFRMPQPATVVLLDTKNTDPEFQPWQIGQVARFVALLKPGEDVAIYQLRNDGLRLLHDFSNDTAHLVNSLPALEHATAREFEKEADDSRLRAARYESTCRSVALLASQMASLSGRKNIFWLAGDFPPLYGVPKKETVHLNSTVISAAAQAVDAANVSLYPVDVRSAFPPETFQRIAPGSVTAIPARRRRAISNEMPAIMTAIAAFTGGKMISNRSELAEAMFDAAGETRFAYEFGFSVPDSDWNGRFHRLEVKTNIRDATVTAKQYYFSGPMPRAIERSAEWLDKTDIGLSVYPTLEAGTKDRLRLTIHIDPANLRWTRTVNDWEAECDVSTSIPGSPAPLWSRAKNFRISDADHRKTNGFDLYFSIDLDTGSSANVRISVRDRVSQLAGSVTLPVSVIRRVHPSN